MPENRRTHGRTIAGLPGYFNQSWGQFRLYHLSRLDGRIAEIRSLAAIFLRHIERCKILLLLLDMAGTDNRAPWDDYHNLLKDLELYDPGLIERPRFVVANKMDEPVAEANLKKFKRRIRKTPVLPISAAFDEGLDRLKQRMREAVEEAVCE
jgi:GTP-binding protein